MSGQRGLVQALGITAAAASVLTLGLYVASPAARPLYAQRAWLWCLPPLLAWWLAHMWRLAKQGKMHQDPVMYATRDPQSWLILILGALTVWLAA